MKSLAAMKKSFWQLASIAALLLVGCASSGGPQSVKVTLTGDQEVPPVMTAASGSGEITIMADHTVTGSITTTGITSTASHIHEGPPDKVSPVIIPLKKTGDNTYVVPEGAKLTDAQYASYKAGNLYVNVHSAKYPVGEIRGRLMPPASPGY